MMPSENQTWEEIKERFEEEKNKFTVYDTSLHTYILNDEKVLQFFSAELNRAIETGYKAGYDAGYRQAVLNTNGLLNNITNPSPTEET